MRLLAAVMLEFAVLILVSNSLIAARAFLAVVFNVAVPTLPDTVDNVLDTLLIALCRLFLVVLIRFVSVVLIKQRIKTDFTDFHGFFYYLPIESGSNL